MGTEQNKENSYIKEYIVGAGYLLFFCLASIFCLIFYYFTFSQHPPAPVNGFATSLPPTTPTPHLAFVDQSKPNKIFEDDFSRDRNHWTLYTEELKEEVRSGKLYFESRIEDNYAFTDCKSCPILNKPFYLQVDLATSKATDKSFGIIFGLNHSTDSLYLFQINTEAKKYYLYHHTYDGWSLRAAGESNHIKAFPAKNILGIYANQAMAEFYINGEIVDSYNQSKPSFQFGYFGFYVDDSDFQLIIDNLTISEVGKK